MIRIKNFNKLLLLVVITVLLLGLVSAAEVNKSSKDNKVVKSTINKESVKSIKTTNKNYSYQGKSKYKKVINNKTNVKKNLKSSENVNTCSTSVSSYDELAEKLENAGSIVNDDTDYIVTLKKGNYNATKSIILRYSNYQKIIIDGNGSTLNGQDKYHFIDSTYLENVNLTIKNIILTNFVNTTLTDGVINSNRNLIIINSTIKNSKGYNTVNCFYNLTIKDSAIINNDAKLILGTREMMVINNCTINNNKGLIYSYNTTINNTVINNNHDDSITNYGNLTLTNSIINNNGTYYTENILEKYYALYNYGIATIKNSTLNNKLFKNMLLQSNNSINYSKHVNSYQELLNEMENVNINVYNSYTITLKKGKYDITNTILWLTNKENIIGNFGLITRNLIIDGNGSTLNGQNKYRFMCLANHDCDEFNLTIKNMIITNCQSEEGGAIYNNQSNLKLINCTFNNNQAKTCGGVLYIDSDIYDGSEINNYIINSTFNNNQATTHSGGAIAGSYLNIINSKFNNNSAKEYGGAIWTGNATIKNSIFENNKNTAITSLTGSLIITGTTFNNNERAIFASETKIFLNNCTLTNHKNSAICILNGSTGSRMTINNSKIINNTAKRIYYIDDEDGKEKYHESVGGAILNMGKLTINNSIITQNSADNGGAIYTMNNLNIYNSTINNNKATLGGAIYVSKGKIKIIKSTLLNNLPKNGTIYIKDLKSYENLNKPPYEIINSTINNMPANITTNITIKLNKTKPYTGSKIKATITLKDKNGKIIKNQKLNIQIANKTYTMTTNNNGIIILTYKTTKTGTQKIIVNYNGTNKYIQSMKTEKFKVLPKIKTKLTLKLSKAKAKVKDKIKITVTLKNNKKKAIKNQKIAIKIGSKTYNKKTNGKGAITLNYRVVKSALGKTVTATYKGNYMYVNSKASKKLVKA